MYHARAMTANVDRKKGLLKPGRRLKPPPMERGSAEVACEFCGAQYRFDAVDAADLFTPESNQPPRSSTIH